jgi:hypothetical protein
MIFRDKNTGSLLNIRRDQHITDRMYFQEIIRRIGGNDSSGNAKHSIPRFRVPFSEFILITAETPLSLKS